MTPRHELNNFHPSTPEAHKGALQTHGGLILRPEMTAIDLWTETGLMDRRPDGSPIHNAPEHMLKVTDTVQVLGNALVQKGILQPEDVIQVMQAASLHDAYKGLEANLVREYLAGSLTQEQFNALLGTLGFHINPATTEEIYGQYELMLEHGDKGIRGLAAYDLAGALSRAKLMEMGFDQQLVTIAGSVGHSSCVEIPYTGDEKLKWMRLVMHYADDVVVNSAIARGVKDDKNALDLRIDANEENPRYREYNTSWPLYAREMYPDYQNTYETAYLMQRAVGHQVEAELSRVLGIENPLSLPDFIEDDLDSRVAGIQVRKTN